MFWRVRRYHPHDERFSPENFGFQPTWLILQALEYGAKLRQEELHLGELGIATLSALFVNCNKDPKKGKPANPSDFWYFQIAEERVDIPAAAADVFFSLIADNLMPGWALGVLPVDQMRKAKRGLPVPSQRAIVGEGVLLLLPTLQVIDKVTSIKCVVAALDGGVSGAVSVSDIDDSGIAFLIEIPSPERQWILSAEFNLVKY